VNKDSHTTSTVQNLTHQDSVKKSLPVLSKFVPAFFPQKIICFIKNVVGASDSSVSMMMIVFIITLGEIM